MIFVLTAKNEFDVIPTILSRCQIYRIKAPSADHEQSVIKDFLRFKTGEKFKSVSKFKKREEAIEFLEEFVSHRHSLLTKESTDLSLMARHIKIAEKTKTSLNANGNLTLQMTNFVVLLESAPSKGDQKKL